jgi:hypothetical protein
MEHTEFLEHKVFTDLKNLYKSTEEETAYHFSEGDFDILLQRVEHYGIGLYKIETWLKGEAQESLHHEDFKKKATDSKWYRKAYNALKTKQPGLSYSADYKISAKLLAR